MSGPKGKRNMKNQFILLLTLLLSCMISYAQNYPVEQWREDTWGGGYIEYIKYSDGSILSAGYAPCIACHRTKVCSVCQGQGAILFPSYGYMPCFSCGQTGRCPACNEDGYCMIMINGIDASGNISSTRLSDFNSSGNNRSSSSHNSSHTTCGYCNGTGVDPQPCDAGRSTWKAYYNSNGNKCPYCGRYDGHMHNRCPRCNVPSH